ncbi:MAG TPA: hypothetical protein VEI97_03925 [bacterium]|nr:hypothetical protein [bacterium]
MDPRPLTSTLLMLLILTGCRGSLPGTPVHAGNQPQSGRPWAGLSGGGSTHVLGTVAMRLANLPTGPVVEVGPVRGGQFGQGDVYDMDLGRQHGPPDLRHMSV